MNPRLEIDVLSLTIPIDHPISKRRKTPIDPRELEMSIEVRRDAFWVWDYTCQLQSDQYFYDLSKDPRWGYRISELPHIDEVYRFVAEQSVAHRGDMIGAFLDPGLQAMETEDRDTPEGASVTTVLDTLYDHWALGVSDIARALDIPNSAVRAWQNGTNPEAAVVARAVELANFLTDVKGAGIEEPASWMSVPIVDGFTATRWGLYVSGRAELLAENATGDLGDVAMLDAFDPNWRPRFWTSYETFTAEDGNLSIRGKSYETVRAQLGPVTPQESV